MDRMGSVPILPVKWTVTIGTMLNFDGDGDGHRDGDGTCKQTLKVCSHLPFYQNGPFFVKHSVNADGLKMDRMGIL